MAKVPTVSRSPWRSAVCAVAAAVLAGLVPTASASLPGPAPELLPGVCAPDADPATAAVAVYGEGTELVETETVAGLGSALVLEPRIAPGTRRRLVAAPDGGWCDAAAGFNRAWTGGGGAAAARAFAAVAATPYFDGVTVRSVSSTGSTHVLETHASTNGVVARWTVVTDSAGVVRGTWTATDFAVAPLVAEEEGLTALPGASETYVRGPGGLLAEQRGLPTVEGAHAASRAKRAPGLATYTSPDGFTVRISVGDARVALDPGVKSGVREADAVQETLEAVALNYQEFHDWGLRKGWRSDLDPALPDTGWVYLNDALSLYCFACVFIADDFQIHMLSEVGVVLAALGFTGYDDPRQAYDNVVGHEMFHNFQNAYVKPGPLGRSSGRRTSTAYSEGTARFQEVLHSYAEVSFAPKTLYTGGQANPPGLSLDANHCNGYGNTQAAFAAGPFPKTYNACYFWNSWYTQNGLDSFVRLVAEGMPAHAPAGNVEEGLAALATAAPDVPVADQLAFSARSALTGRHKAIAPASGGGEALDWGSFLFRLDPPALEPGASAPLTGAGVLTRRVTGEATVSLSGEGLALYEVRSTSAGDTMRPLPTTAATVPAPAAGEDVWVVAVNPKPQTTTATFEVA